MVDTAARTELRFPATPAVSASRAHRRFVVCPICQADHARYLFHKTGVRYVRCAVCGMVYISPARARPLNYFDMQRERSFADEHDRALALRDIGRLLERAASDCRRVTQAPVTRAVFVGRFLRGIRDLPEARRMGLELVEVDDAAFARMAESSDVSFAREALASGPQLVVLNEVLEACSEPSVVVRELVSACPPSTLFAVVYTNVESFPARIMRRWWPPFFDYKAAFFGTGNLCALMASCGLVVKSQFPMPVTRTVKYARERLGLETTGARLLSAALDDVELPLLLGNRVILFGKSAAAAQGMQEKLSIVMPVFNEARYVAQVIDAVLAKELPIDKELIIVESNSTDGTREIVRRYEGHPGVKVIYEDRPRGKGHAVRTGLRHITGTIVLIQDADLEYDIDDYDALLEPILLRKTSFVLGSRSLGLDDWKVRKYTATPLRGVVLNLAQMAFAKTYELLYQQRVTDVNTMFKVFRAECLDGLDLRSDGFELDIEIACKLARNGYSPLEVPVNYVARGFEEGKKIRWTDAWPGYVAFFKYRFD
jgi:Zn ribbon nucleic-acid-binding protein